MKDQNCPQRVPKLMEEINMYVIIFQMSSLCVKHVFGVCDMWFRTHVLYHEGQTLYEDFLMQSDLSLL